MSSVKLFVFSSLTAFCVSCHQEGQNKVRESVLTSGQTIEAKNSNGTVKISYVDPVRRKYEWNGERRIVRLYPREERFRGKLGLYDPADSWIFLLRNTRLVLDEAIRDFDSQEKAQAALIESSAYMDWVYTPNGLVVGFGRSPERKQINIDVFQLLIRGQKPTELAGSRPSQISVIYANQ